MTRGSIPAAKTAGPRAGRRRRRTAIVSQSGAFLLNRFSQAPEMSPAYLISMGNQTDLTLGDMMRHFIELGRGGRHRRLCGRLQGSRRAAVRDRPSAKPCGNGKQVIFYKAGRTPEGKNGHQRAHSLSRRGLHGL